MPGGVARHGRIDVGGNEPEVGGGELPLARVAFRVAQRLELLEVGEFADVDLDRQVAPDRVLELLVRREIAAREGPAACEGLFRSFPQQYLEGAVPHLEDDGQGHMCRSGRFRLRGGNRARLWLRF